jgi:hypothetical protein
LKFDNNIKTSIENEKEREPRKDFAEAEGKLGLKLLPRVVQWNRICDFPLKHLFIKS